MKTDIEQLAILGGPPEFAEPVHVGRPNQGDRAKLLSRIEDILDRNWLTNDGPYVQEFEDQVATRLGVAHCVATANGTVALEIVVRALGLTGEVIVPSFTFVATAHALLWQGIRPVFGDIDPMTHTLDPAQVEKLVTEETTGVLGVHLWGSPCDVDGLRVVTDRHDLVLLFDAAHAFGSTLGGRAIGSFGRAEVLSFHATKFINSFEGGAIVTDDDDIAAQARLLRNFGFVAYDEVAALGTNGKLSEVAAAMGLTSLESMDEIVRHNLSNHSAYEERLAEVDGIRVLPLPAGESHNAQYVVVEIDEVVTGISRDDLMQLLWAENVRARRYFYPGVHRMEPYRSLSPDLDERLPNTLLAAHRTLVLPTGTALDESGIARICALVRLGVEKSGGLTRDLSV